MSNDILEYIVEIPWYYPWWCDIGCLILTLPAFSAFNYRKYSCIEVAITSLYYWVLIRIPMFSVPGLLLAIAMGAGFDDTFLQVFVSTGFLGLPICVPFAVKAFDSFLDAANEWRYASECLPKCMSYVAKREKSITMDEMMTVPEVCKVRKAYQSHNCYASFTIESQMKREYIRVKALEKAEKIARLRVKKDRKKRLKKYSECNFLVRWMCGYYLHYRSDDYPGRADNKKNRNVACKNRKEDNR